jgi:hypothetical protein
MRSPGECANETCPSARRTATKAARLALLSLLAWLVILIVAVAGDRLLHLLH